MDSKAITRILLVAGMAALLLALSVAGLALGQAPAVTADSPCDNVCVDPSCVPVPVDWLGPITITNTPIIIYPTSACLCENGSRVEGEGEFFLPNIQTDQGTDGIYVKFVMDVVSEGLPWELKPQCVQFTGTWEEGIPIGESGFLLTSMEGEVIFEPEPSVQVAGTIESEQQMPGDGPAVTGEGTLSVSLEEPYEVGFEGTLEVFAIGAIQAAMTLDQSWGFAGSVILTVPGCDGGAFLHAWEEGDGVYGFTGSASLTCTIGRCLLTPDWWPDWLPCIPPEDILTTTVEAEVGEFCLGCDEAQCVQKTYGVWAGIGLELPLLEPVVEPGTIVARCFLSSTGIISCTTNLEPCAQTNQVEVMEDALHEGTILSDVHNVEVAVRPTDLTIFVVEWQRGHPSITLIDPHGTELSPASVTGQDSLVYMPGPKGAAFFVKEPQPGPWQVQLAGLSGDEAYNLYLICLNESPTITITSPTASEEPGSESYTIHWTADDPDDEAVVSLYYDRDGTGRDGRLIAYCLSEGDGSYVWDTSEVGSGTYYVYGRIDDGKNLAGVSYSVGTVKVEDSTVPAAPSGLSVSLEDGVVELSWQANAEDDVIGYEVYYRTEPYTDTGSYDATNVTSFRLPRKPSSATAYMAVSAYDSSGNSSPLSEWVRLWFVYLPLVNQH